MVHCRPTLPRGLEFDTTIRRGAWANKVSIVLAVICLIVGLLIGAIGIGGVLLLPALVYLGGIDVHAAVPVCMLSFVAAGIVGSIVYHRHGSIRIDLAAWLCAGAIPAAFAGALALPWIPAGLIMALVALLMILAGVDALVKSLRPVAPATSRLPGRGALVALGFVTGFGSALTGTGGPLIMVPTAIFLGLPVLIAVGLGMAIQIPIAAFASLGNWIAGSLDVGLAVVLAAIMGCGVLIGALAIHRVPGGQLRRFVAGMLILIGTGLLIRLLLQL